MAEDQWYYYHEGERQGPLPFGELRALAEAGKLLPEDLVSRPGMSNWIAAREVEGLFAEGELLPPPPRASKAGFMERLRGLGASEDLVEVLPHLRWVRALLERLRSWFSQDLLESVDRWSKVVGSFALLGAAMLLLLGFLILGIRANNVVLLLVGVIAVPLVTVLVHYLAAMFLDAGRSLLHESPSALSSDAFLACFGLLALTGALVAVLTGLFAAFGGRIMSLVAGLGVAAVCLYVGAVALSPASVNVDVEGKASAGEEAVGVLTFLFKLLLRLVPFVFGVGMVLGLCAAAFQLWQSMARDPFMAQITSGPTAAGVFGVALVPLGVYLVFLLLYLQLDVLRAVLSLPGKLDALKEGKKK